jgi:hypothetical protein
MLSDDGGRCTLCSMSGHLVSFLAISVTAISHGCDVNRRNPAVCGTPSTNKSRNRTTSVLSRSSFLPYCFPRGIENTRSTPSFCKSIPFGARWASASTSTFPSSGIQLAFTSVDLGGVLGGRFFDGGWSEEVEDE